MPQHRYIRGAVKIRLREKPSRTQHNVIHRKIRRRIPLQRNIVRLPLPKLRHHRAFIELVVCILQRGRRRHQRALSAVGRTPITGNRNIHNTFVPNCATISETEAFNPVITEEIVITVITPITIPRIVNPERILFARSVSSAIFTDSR